MSVGSSAEILVLSNTQAKALAGSLLAIGEDLFPAQDYDPAYPGQPPWRSGAEGKAYPLLARTARWPPTSSSSRGRRRVGSIGPPG